MSPTVEARFWEKVEPEPNTGHFIWIGARRGRGYGAMNIGTWRKPKVTAAHRISWVLHHGDIHESVGVLHRCDLPWCVAPSHLFLGTHADNMRDAASKGRYASQRRTQCPQGHPYDEENTYRWNRQRFCRACNRIYSARKGAA